MQRMIDLGEHPDWQNFDMLLHKLMLVLFRQKSWYVITTQTILLSSDSHNRHYRNENSCKLGTESEHKHQ